MLRNTLETEVAQRLREVREAEIEFTRIDRQLAVENEELIRVTNATRDSAKQGPFASNLMPRGREQQINRKVEEATRGLTRHVEEIARARGSAERVLQDKKSGLEAAQRRLTDFVKADTSSAPVNAGVVITPAVDAGREDTAVLRRLVETQQKQIEMLTRMMAQMRRGGEGAAAEADDEPRAGPRP